MGLQPSASKTELFLACQRPFDPAVTTEPTFATEPMRYGSAFHASIALLLLKALKKPEGALYEKAVIAAAAKYDVRQHVKELAEHVRVSYEYLTSWLKKHGWTRIVEVEQSYAISGGSPRKIDGPSDEDHFYSDLRPGEIAGTVDSCRREV